MNETSGTTMHDSLGRNDGNASHVRFGLPGINGDGYGASGVNSLVTVPSSPTLNPAGQTFSFGLSVRFLTVPKSGYDLLRKGFKAAKGDFFKLEALARQQHQAAQARCLFAGSTGAAKVVDRQSRGRCLAHDRLHEDAPHRQSDSRWTNVHETGLCRRD